MFNPSRWSTGMKIAGASIGAILIFVGGAALSGIIGNSADAIFIWLWDQVTKSFIINPWSWIITFAAVVVCGYLWQRSGISNYALNTMNHIVKLDNTLLRALPNLTSADDQEDAMKRLLIQLLKNAAVTLNEDVHRASILLPDTSGEYLKIWMSYQMPETSINRSKFYIGPEKNRKKDRGVAGKAFLEKEIIIAHRIDEGGRCRFGENDFIEFDGDRLFPPYRSFVCIPIIGIDNQSSSVKNNSCLGIVCFDSTSPKTFDSPAVKDLLISLGTRIATALLIYQQSPTVLLNEIVANKQQSEVNITTQDNRTKQSD